MYLDIISAPLTDIKLHPHYPATQRANKLFPVPGGPYNKTPDPGETPKLLNISGFLIGSSIISLSS